MERIKTVEKLITILEQKPARGSYLDVMQSIDIPLREFEKYYSWDKDAITRNCLVKTDDFELLLICYEKGQKTPIHDFYSQQAWINMIHGKLCEDRFRVSEDGMKLEQLSSITLSTNDYSFMNKVGIHQYRNVYESRSVSLNLYSKPITDWTEYDKKAQKKIVKIKYYSVYV